MTDLDIYLDAMRGDLSEAKAVRGKAQKAVMKAVQNGKINLVDMARLPDFRGIHFSQIMKSVETLNRAGHLKFDPETQTVSPR